MSRISSRSVFLPSMPDRSSTRLLVSSSRTPFLISGRCSFTLSTMSGAETLRSMPTWRKRSAAFAGEVHRERIERHVHRRLRVFLRRLFRVLVALVLLAAEKEERRTAAAERARTTATMAISRIGFFFLPAAGGCACLGFCWPCVPSICLRDLAEMTHATRLIAPRSCRSRFRARSSIQLRNNRLGAQLAVLCNPLPVNLQDKPRVASLPPQPQNEKARGRSPSGLRLRSPARWLRRTGRPGRGRRRAAAR